MDDGGLGKFNRWGWCGEGCPLEGSDTTWGTDETLTSTTEFVKKTDPDIYKAMIGLGILAIALVIMAGVIKFFGMCLNCHFSLKFIFITDKTISKVTRWLIVKAGGC